MRPRSLDLHLLKAILSLLPLVLLLSACTADSAQSDWEKAEQSAQQAATAGNMSEAEQLHLTAIEKAEHIIDSEPLVTSLVALSDFYSNSNQPEKCRDLLVRAVTISEKQLREGNGKSENWRLLSAQTSLNLANIYRDQGWFTYAEPLYCRAEELTPETAGGAYELSTKIRKDHKQMKENRQNSDRNFDDVLTSGKTNFGKDRTKEKLEFDKQWKASETLEFSLPSAKVETDLKNLFAFAKKLYDLRDPKYRVALQKLITYYNRQSDYKKAMELIEEDEKRFLSVENLTRAEAEKDPEKDVDAQILSNDLHLLADMACKKGQMQKGADYQKRAIALRERWGPADLTLIMMHRGLSDLENTLHNPESAMVHIERAFKVLDSMEKRENHKHWDVREQMLVTMAGLERGQGSFQESARHLAEAHAMFDRHPDGKPDFYSTIMLEEAELAKSMSNRKQQKACLDNAVAYWSKNKPQDAYHKWLCSQRVGLFHYAVYDYAEALKTFQNSYQIALSNPTMTADADAVIDTLQWIGYTEVRLNQAAAAERHYKEALELSKKRTLENLNGKANLLMNFANLDKQIGRLAQAESSYKDIVAICQKDPDHCYETLYNAMTYMADLQTYKGDPATARDIEGKAYKIVQNHKERPDLIVKSLTRQGASALYDGDLKTARKHFENAETILISASLGDPLLQYPLYMSLASLYWLTGENSKIAVSEDKAKKALKVADIPPDYPLWDWAWDQSSRWHLKPVTTYPVTAGRVVETAQSRAKLFKSKELRGLWPACSERIVATLLKWRGFPKESQQLEELARTSSDAEIKRHPLR